MAKIKVVGITGNVTTPSARFRVGQFVKPLAQHGVDLAWRPAPVSAYPPQRRWLRPLWAPVTLAARVPDIIRTHQADLTLLNREFLSTFATIERWTGCPRVLDVDDAIWVRRGGGYAQRLARESDMVIAGNSFLAEWFSRFCKRVEILPTAVDTNRFHPATRESTQPAVIGWSGTSVNFRFLQELEPALRKVLQERPDARLAICADRPPNFLSLPMDRVDFIPWSPAIEVSFIQSLAIGLMPLTDGEWARGKCSYKMLLYLACGVPAVVSPVGMNQEILAAGSVGLAASDEREWVSAMVDLLDDAADRRCRGENGRRLVVEKFSVDVVARHLSEFLKQAAAGSYGSNGSCVA